jgi:predicted nucleic acid-binding protein
VSDIVIDASIAADWLLDDEFDPTAAAALSRLMQDGGIVPQLWNAEVRNALLTAERRGRVSPENSRNRLDGLGLLPIRTDMDPDLDVTMDLARNHGLSFYDALYLELAKRLNVELATLDLTLARAAAAEGLSLDLS